MTDYTPTTEEVRAEYVDCTAGMYDAYAEFDRWLAERDRQQRAIGWYEGEKAGQHNHEMEYSWSAEGSIIENPYREGETK